MMVVLDLTASCLKRAKWQWVEEIMEWNILQCAVQDVSVHVKTILDETSLSESADTECITL